ncbi:hypothetical protein LUZ60_014242 [Juncus effusus]|nr:hypothetical protein LUZ60_014242 [Juncus effusus]
MEKALEMARSTDFKVRMAGVERLCRALEKSSGDLSASEAAALVECCLDLLQDANPVAAEGALFLLSFGACLAGDHFKIRLDLLVPAAVDRLGDENLLVRGAARQLLVTLMEVSSPAIVMERAGGFAWTNESWRVREQFVRTVGSAAVLFGTDLPLMHALLPNVLHLLNDPIQSVRDAAMSCIEEIYKQMGPQLREELPRHDLPSCTLKDINRRIKKVVPKAWKARQAKATNPKSNCPWTNKSTPIFACADVAPIQVCSEEELVREFENIASFLVPDMDWSARIAAMQRIEALVCGGATNYPSFLVLLEQLVPCLSTQLQDVRLSIVDQACHLLNMLSKELLGDFESCAEIFIPLLFKHLAITGLVIGKSSDKCIKTMLSNCKAAGLLPKITDMAKNDRSAIIRARCCEYALLVLEYWADAPEIQTSVDYYEDLIRCCVADEMSKVRSAAMSCYRMYSKTWPERSHSLLMSFDPSIQRSLEPETESEQIETLVETMVSAMVVSLPTEVAESSEQRKYKKTGGWPCKVCKRKINITPEQERNLESVECKTCEKKRQRKKDSKLPKMIHKYN